MSQNDPTVIDGLSDMETDDHWISHRDYSTHTMSGGSDSTKWHFHTASATTTDSPPETSTQRTILSTSGNPSSSPLRPFKSHLISSSPRLTTEPRETPRPPKSASERTGIQADSMIVLKSNLAAKQKPDGSHTTADIIYLDDEDNLSDTENSGASSAWHKKLQETAESSWSTVVGGSTQFRTLHQTSDHNQATTTARRQKSQRASKGCKLLVGAVSSRVISRKQKPERRSSNRTTATRGDAKIQALEALKKWELVDAVLNTPDEGGRFVLTFGLPSTSHMTSSPQNDRVKPGSHSAKKYPVRRLLEKWGNAFLIEWENDEITWERKMNVNKHLVAAFEKQYDGYGPGIESIRGSRKKGGRKQLRLAWRQRPLSEAYWIDKSTVLPRTAWPVHAWEFFCLESCFVE
ncbi:uncharacterized protein B0I36DRAFT_350497 [Microdochium trichocladiopsis]|uniref:Chromo domain-containing protein n=1 Tax=Microdochium trichocladiopsis TaxID=1682393 RepID=A0A9P8Y5C2_9PEZI|nr:uncharacterized protein B0I36DRAFT_350497 [Microdochium trichocladiopsis]KAH7029659.1 hypothetical protein B0I36DRAFT_350497 [Microdochium trichocladiopsis]